MNTNDNCWIYQEYIHPIYSPRQQQEGDYKSSSDKAKHTLAKEIKEVLRLQKEVDVCIAVSWEKSTAYRYCYITQQSKSLSGWINLDPEESGLISAAAGSKLADFLWNTTAALGVLQVNIGVKYFGGNDSWRLSDSCQRAQDPSWLADRQQDYDQLFIFPRTSLRLSRLRPLLTAGVYKMESRIGISLPTLSLTSKKVRSQ